LGNIEVNRMKNNTKKPEENLVANHLSKERSPYLKQHAADPVDWYPWCEEAFEKAKNEDKPVFLSIGYSTCHWCHVMAKESFRDPQVAQILNEYFVSIKVDREERPDIDTIYMQACAMVTGSGGWPMTILMTPEQKPFFVATYMPKNSTYGRMGLLQVLQAVAGKWKRDRESLIKTGNDLTGYLKKDMLRTEQTPDREFLDKVYRQFEDSYDEKCGGFGTAPKFPAAHNLLFLLRYSYATKMKKAREMADFTLQQMYRGGIFDHLGGGFARYSTDREWLAPHFEKTLYDNALLTLTYTEAWKEGHFDLYRDVAERILDYCIRELRTEKGAYFCGQDADTDGKEGLYYLFDASEIDEALGAEDGKIFRECYDITEQGNFHGRNIPNLLLTQQWNLLPEKYEDLREKLRIYREQRTQLPVDDKVLTGWNGLMLSALSKAAAAFHDPRYAQAARELAGFIRADCGLDAPEKFCACYYDADNRTPAQLDDYVFCALGMLNCYEVDYDPEMLLCASGTAKYVVEHFADPAGGFFRTSDQHETLIKRPKEVFDSAMPSGNGAAAVLFERLWRFSGEEDWRDQAQKQLEFLCSVSGKYPSGISSAMPVLFNQIFSTREILCAAEEVPELVRKMSEKYMPDMSVLVKFEDDADRLKSFAPFTGDFKRIDEKTTYCVCSNGACGLPFTEDSFSTENLG